MSTETETPINERHFEYCPCALCSSKVMKDTTELEYHGASPWLDVDTFNEEAPPGVYMLRVDPHQRILIEHHDGERSFYLSTWGNEWGEEKNSDYRREDPFEIFPIHGVFGPVDPEYSLW